MISPVACSRTVGLYIGNAQLGGDTETHRGDTETQRGGGHRNTQVLGHSYGYTHTHTDRGSNRGGAQLKMSEIQNVFK